jgi:lytic murein transglycosylase
MGASDGSSAGVCLIRSALRAALVLLTATFGSPPSGAQDSITPGFQRFLTELWPEAQALGVSRATFDLALRGVTADTTLPDLILPGTQRPSGAGQAEFTKTPADYINAVQLARLADQGRALLKQHTATLDAVERQIGVDRHVVLAIWGRETAYGGYKPTHGAIRALATQAYLGRRKDMFRGELLAALKMIEVKAMAPDAKASWAGAMGLTQFMPSEYFTLARDMDGDGKKDIWGSVPDALGSAANQLKEKGWIAGLPWGFEVRLPPAATCLMEGIPQKRPVRDWLAAGVTPLVKMEMTQALAAADAFLIKPAGPYGPAFLATENYLTIKRYNMSDLYVLFVGNLADRIAGGGDFSTKWAALKQLPTREIEEIQERLKAVGYPIEKVDGKAGMNTRNQIGAYQKVKGLELDCWPSETVLKHLRQTAAR